MGGNYSVAIDLGGTIIKIGLILDSEIVRFTTISSDSVRGLSHMLPKMEHAIDSLLSEEGISSTDLVSIGLAFPGMVNPVECRVISTNDKYDDACDIDLCHWADSRWGVPFVLERCPSCCHRRVALRCSERYGKCGNDDYRYRNRNRCYIR